MITLLLTLIIIGVALYLVETYIPMSPPIKTVIRVIVVDSNSLVASCLWCIGCSSHTITISTTGIERMIPD
jgi:hypothetical protein